jgi:hypothetical protein
MGWSWAARYQGEAGPLPTDVDVLVVWTADLDDLDEVALSAGRLRRRGPEPGHHHRGAIPHETRREPRIRCAEDGIELQDAVRST